MCYTKTFAKLLSLLPWAVLCLGVSDSLRLRGLQAHQASLPMEFSKQEYWSGLPFPIPGYFPDSEIEPEPLVPHALTGRFLTTGTTWEAP